MTNTIHIIETGTIRKGDLVAFRGPNDAGDAAGIAMGFNDAGEIDVEYATPAGAVVLSVPHEWVTDICA